MHRAKFMALAISTLSGSVFGQSPSWQVIVLTPPGAYQARVTAVRAGRQFGTSYFESTSNYQAGFWSGSAGTWTPLTSPSLSSGVNGADETQQVGSVGIGLGHAALWRGTPESFVDLHPAVGAYSSGIGGVFGKTQVGAFTVLSTGLGHAALWRGTQESFLDLHPAGASESSALTTDGTLQGGSVTWTGTYPPHAAIWQGTPGSMIDINPVIAGASEIRAMVPGVQVGYTINASGHQAALWRGTAASYVNMNPPGATYAEFFATNGAVHAGTLAQGSLSRAAVNFGTPSSWVALHQFLPPQYGGTSAALSVYQDGPTIYVGGWAGNGTDGNDAILWIGTVPCYANCDSSTALPSLNANDFNCFLNKFAAGNSYANCDGSTASPILNANDFNCFINAFAAQCP